MDWINEHLAQYRPAVISVLGVASPILYGYWAETQKTRYPCLFCVSMLILLWAAFVPNRYAKVRLVESLLPVIHSILKLEENDRVTVHHIRSNWREKYQQLADYYPQKFGGRGRVFSFSHGIAGECFKKMGTQYWTMPDGKTFEQAMKERWNFAPEELSRLTKDRKSFFVAAIGKYGSRTKAVLYMDSSDGARFSAMTFPGLERTTTQLIVPLLERLLAD